MKILATLLILAHSVTSFSQCFVPAHMITDQTTSVDLLQMMQGEIIRERPNESFIWRLHYVSCPESDDVVVMTTSSGVYWYTHDDALLHEWMDAPSIVEYWNKNVRDSDNWAYRNLAEKAMRCTAISKKNIRCKRLTYHKDNLCWQHR